MLGCSGVRHNVVPYKSLLARLYSFFDHVNLILRRWLMANLVSLPSIEQEDRGPRPECSKLAVLKVLANPVRP